jgi:hypothetical protein
MPETLRALRERCGDDVVRLTSARDVILGFPRRLLPIKRWILIERWIVREFGEAFVRCAPGLRELHLFDRFGQRLVRVSFRQSLDSVDACVWRLMHADQRPAKHA